MQIQQIESLFGSGRGCLHEVINLHLFPVAGAVIPKRIVDRIGLVSVVPGLIVVALAWTTKEPVHAAEVQGRPVSLNWSALPGATRRLWESFIEGVEAHERVHGDFIMEMARKIEAVSVGIEPACSSMQETPMPRSFFRFAASRLRLAKLA